MRRYQRRSFRRSPAKNRQWTGANASAPATIPGNANALFPILTATSGDAVSNRMNRTVINRIVGEIAIWYPFTTPPAATISAFYTAGVKVADNILPSTSLLQPQINSGDDWMWWRGGWLGANSTGDAFAAQRFELDIKTKRVFRPINDILYVSVSNVGTAEIRAWTSLRVLLVET